MNTLDSARTSGQFSTIAQTSQTSFIDPALVSFMEKGGSTAAIMFVSFAGVCSVLYFMNLMLSTALQVKKR
ncbi:MAG: hypothetical protein KME15_26455 [Drouetiella hepatica Uher 2000/2452]|jgi:hypothetical protein|uniref:Uncharacterized protein n=1 Tax=Drouetiella hepatica Uher 2000/2452 TaxID=904376 RepID=A0A951UQB2_9CYAN|nr:hypothetical protein [Drouetiella hepatica Uher 2000/2452]